jgi:hypothetical protein
MATGVVPKLPDTKGLDPAQMSFTQSYKSGALKDPLVHYNHINRILTDYSIIAGAGGSNAVNRIFTSRTVFSAAATGAWQLPTAVQLLTELYATVYGALFPKRATAFLGQSFEATARFRNDTAADITITTNTGLTLVPSPITIPAGSSVILIFEVVGSTFATAAFNVYVENGGAGASSTSVTIIAEPALTAVNTGINEWTIGVSGPAQDYTVTNEILSWDPVNEVFETRGVINQQTAILNFQGGPVQPLTLAYDEVLWPVATVPAAIATYAAGTGIATIVKPGPYQINAAFSSVAMTAGPLGQPIPPTGMPATERGSAILLANGAPLYEIGWGDEGIGNGSVRLNLAVGDTLQWVAGQSGGALSDIEVGSYWNFGPIF